MPVVPAAMMPGVSVRLSVRHFWGEAEGRMGERGSGRERRRAADSRWGCGAAYRSFVWVVRGLRGRAPGGREAAERGLANKRTGLGYASTGSATAGYRVAKNGVASELLEVGAARLRVEMETRSAE